MKKLIVMLAVIMFSSFATFSFAQDNAKEQGKKTDPVVTSDVQEAQGEIIAITKRSISLVTSRDKDTGAETELLLPFDKQLIIEHKKSLSEIQVGDLVKVKYIVDTKDYGDRKKSETRVKVITFTAPAPQDSPYKKAYEKTSSENSAAPDSTENQPLTLKGAKQ